MKSYKIKSFLFLFIILFSPASNAFCEEVYYNDAKIKMLIPADWTMQYEENGQIAIGPNGDIVIIFMLMKSDATSDAIIELKDHINSFIADVKETTNIEPLTLNGLSGYAYDARGVLNKSRPIDIGAMILINTNNKIVMVLALAISETYKKYEESFLSIIDSISPVSVKVLKEK
ncbi:MAG TPA: hypothetical protein PLG34_10080 [Spirochaetota bacterium]|jgi:hypothetical protein|nr:MAG: hypothetical protein BWX91_00275 [Spirochaetes bacterium ADurb.Bin133]HNZ25949.1 hypothetical protein [Spirochaetota bacterium]HPY88319.1 hypothetical protein [Spirochaetota bacterium]